MRKECSQEGLVRSWERPNNIVLTHSLTTV
jgi:hypothetical protein